MFDLPSHSYAVSNTKQIFTSKITQAHQHRVYFRFVNSLSSKLVIFQSFPVVLEILHAIPGCSERRIGRVVLSVSIKRYNSSFVLAARMQLTRSHMAVVKVHSAPPILMHNHIFTVRRIIPRLPLVVSAIPFSLRLLVHRYPLPHATYTRARTYRRRAHMPLSSALL